VPYKKPVLHGVSCKPGKDSLLEDNSYRQLASHTHGYASLSQDSQPSCK
jgi:hypothetical protein